MSSKDTLSREWDAPEEQWMTVQDMFEAEGCDGFVLTPTISPLMWEEFARMLTPELQRRGLLRTEYSGATMRENLRT